MVMEHTVEGHAGVTATEQPAQEQRDDITRLNFSNPRPRDAHIRAFLEWLPPMLHEASGIRWEDTPSRVMGYLIRTVADSPDTIPITLAIGCALAMKRNAL